MSGERVKQCVWTVISFAVAAVVVYFFFGKTTTLEPTGLLIASGIGGTIAAIVAGVVTNPQ